MVHYGKRHGLEESGERAWTRIKERREWAMWHGRARIHQDSEG